jgi:glutamine synthetase
MHTNVSVSKGKTNLFWDEKGEEQLSKFGWDFLDRILTHALDLCLVFNSSVNAYRRLDPHFEAPNQIRASAVDRGAMVRVPIGNHRSMRTEVRAVAPDANPYLSLYSIFKTGIDGTISNGSTTCAPVAAICPTTSRRPSTTSSPRRGLRRFWAPTCRAATPT